MSCHSQSLGSGSGVHECVSQRLSAFDAVQSNILFKTDNAKKINRCLNVTIFSTCALVTIVLQLTLTIACLFQQQQDTSFYNIAGRPHCKHVYNCLDKSQF